MGWVLGGLWALTFGALLALVLTLYDDGYRHGFRDAQSLVSSTLEGIDRL